MVTSTSWILRAAREWLFVSHTVVQWRSGSSPGWLSFKWWPRNLGCFHTEVMSCGTKDYQCHHARRREAGGCEAYFKIISSPTYVSWTRTQWSHPPHCCCGWYSAHMLWKKDGVKAASPFKIMRGKCCIGVWPMCEKVLVKMKYLTGDKSALENIWALDVLNRVTNCLN